MESKKLDDILGEKMITPSILHSGYRSQQPVQQQPVQQQPVQQQTVQQQPVQQQPSIRPMPIEPISMPIKIQPMPLEPIEMPFKILPMPVEPVQMPLAQQPVTVNVQAQPTYNAEQMQQVEMDFQLVYPDIYYKLQPHIRNACDRMDTQGPQMPTQQMVENLSEGIFSEVCRLYPELAAQCNNSEMSLDDAALQTRSRRRGCCRNPCSRPTPYWRTIRAGTDQGPNRNPQNLPYGQRPRYYGCCGRRGMLGDLISIMLLNELSRRRRRFY